ncbi:MAG: hypothetical protein ACRDJC_17335, partial [Thermomicrobiales bacterium]
NPELEQALLDLGRRLTNPVTPDIASRVRANLEAETAPTPRRAPIISFPGRRTWLAAACLLVAILAGLALFPEARTAIADRLGLRGVVIRWIDEEALPEPSPIGTPLQLGRPVTLEDAQEAVDFPVLAPTAPGFATPGEVFLSGEDQNAMISFVYPAAPDLPASDETGVGALLTQFRGEPERGLIEKGLAGEGVDPQTHLEPVSVNGQPGFWITGAPHAVFFVCFDVGECREERSRLAGNVLLWEHDGNTLRLESALSRDAALAVAASVRPAE